MDLRVTVVQSDLVWHGPHENLDRFGEKIRMLGDETDLIILPEMFTTGFTTNIAAVDGVSSEYVVKKMQKWSEEKNSAICGSVLFAEGGRNYNRCYLVEPSGECHKYDKRHLFRMAGEGAHFQSGQENVVVNYRGWRLCLQICYDLRFPVWSRNVNLKYDALIYVANWPKTRVDAWSTLLRARAIENCSYVVGVNRVGRDGNGIDYCGRSTVVDYEGRVIYEKQDVEDVHTLVLDKVALQAYRNRFPSWLDADVFEINMDG